MENNKELFVKIVDLEIIDEDIKGTFDDQDYKYEKNYSIVKEGENSKKQTIKITFIESTNRDLFVKVGTITSQCYKCLKYAHIAKY